MVDAVYWLHIGCLRRRFKVCAFFSETRRTRCHDIVLRRSVREDLADTERPPCGEEEDCGVKTDSKSAVRRDDHV